MFSTKEQLEKRTPKGGIKREDYINLLASEFYETANAGKLRHSTTQFFFFSSIFRYLLFLFTFKFIYFFTVKIFRCQRTSHSKPSKFCVRSNKLRLLKKKQCTRLIFIFNCLR